MVPSVVPRCQACASPCTASLDRVLRATLPIIMCLLLAACGTTPRERTSGAVSRCDSFLIYRICIRDQDSDGSADFMYFADTGEIFMYRPELRRQASNRFDLPFHPCAVPMAADTRMLSSQLLYGDDLSFTERLGVKRRLIEQYFEARPQIQACNQQRRSTAEDRPFLEDEDW